MKLQRILKQAQATINKLEKLASFNERKVVILEDNIHKLRVKRTEATKEAAEAKRVADNFKKLIGQQD